MKKYKYKLLKTEDAKNMSFDGFIGEFENQRTSADGKYLIVKALIENTEGDFWLSHNQARVLVDSPMWNKKKIKNVQSIFRK